MATYNRPWFKPAPDRGLVIGADVANGLQKGIQQAMQLKMQRARVNALQTNAQAMMEYRKAMANRYAPVNSEKVALALEAYNHPGVPKDVSGPLLKQQVKAAFDAADTPEKVQQLKQQLGQKIQGMTPQDQNQWARPMTEGDPNFRGPQTPDSMLPQGQPGAPELNYNEGQAFNKALAGQTKLQGIGISEAGKTGRNASTNATREVVAAGNNAATVAASKVKGADAAGIRTQGKGASANPEIKMHQDAYRALSQQYAAADKPNQFGMAPSPTDVASRRGALQDMMNQHLDAIHKLQQPGSQAPGATQTTPPPAQPKVLPSDQWQNAQAGDYVALPQGGYHKALGSGKFDPQPYAQVPGAAPAAAPPAAQAAPEPAAPPPPPPPMMPVGMGVMDTGS